MKSQFFFKIFFQWHERSFFCTFLAETLYVIDKSSTSKFKFLYLPLLVFKFTKFFMSFLEPRASFSSNFASLFSVMTHNASILFHLNLYMLWKKNPIKVGIFWLSTAHMKINQIPDVIFQATSQLFFKFCNILQCHDILKFSNWNISCVGQKEPINMQFFRLLGSLLKFDPTLLFLFS